MHGQQNIKISCTNFSNLFLE